MSGRARRRHDKERAVGHARRVARDVWRDSTEAKNAWIVHHLAQRGEHVTMEELRAQDEMAARKRADNLKQCGGSCCSRPRRREGESFADRRRKASGDD